LSCEPALWDNFLWTDEPLRRRLRIRRGEILGEPLVGNGTQNMPDAKLVRAKESLGLR
jgi:hypothetical protein